MAETARTKPTNQSRSLYESFRDGLIDDAVSRNAHEFDPWKLIPEVHIGRMQTVSLIRKMAAKMRKEFPGGVIEKKGKFLLQADLIEFAKTHREIGSTSEEMVAAWAAMRSIQ